MQFNNRQMMAIVGILLTGVILITISALALVPLWMEPDSNLLVPSLGLLMSPLAILPIVLLPTVLFLRWGWPERVDLKAYLLPLRLALAYEFLHGGIEKLLDTTYLSSPGLIGYGAAAAPSQWVRDVLTMLLPNYQAFLLLIAVGEVLIGTSMLVGGATRLGAAGGVIIQWTFMFLLGWLSISTFGVNFVGSMAFLVLGMHHSGRFLGIDAVLAKSLGQSRNIVARLVVFLT